MALWDFLKNLGNNNAQTGGAANTQGGLGGLFGGLTGNANQGNNTPQLSPLQVNNVSNTPQLPTLQIDNDGNIDPIKSAQVELQNAQSKPLTMGERLLGRTLSKDIQTVNPETGEATLQTVTNFKPGLFNDLINGANENFNNKFDVSNWGDTKTADGRKKGAAYRIGEGIGSLARGLATWGGDAWTAGAQGLDAAMARQNMRVGDKLYRQQLKDQYGYTDDQLDNLGGYVSKDVYNTLATNAYRNQALQVRQDIADINDKTKRANLIMRGLGNGTITPKEAKDLMVNYGITFEDLQKSNATRNTEINEMLAPHRANYYDNAVANPLGWANYDLKAKDARLKEEETERRLNALESLINGGGGNTAPSGGTTKSGNRYKVIN